MSLDVLPDAVQSWLWLFRPSLEDWSEEMQPKAVLALDLDAWRDGFQFQLD